MLAIIIRRLHFGSAILAQLIWPYDFSFENTTNQISVK
jgi:hypothetical protein